MNPLNVVRAAALPMNEATNALHWKWLEAKTPIDCKKQLTREDFNVRVCEPRGAQTPQAKTCLMLEKNFRQTKDMNTFMQSHRMFNNQRAASVLSKKPGICQDWEKPDYLVQRKFPEPTGNRQVFSQFSGWLTIDESRGMRRKNAPETEIGQQKLNEEQKLSQRPAFIYDHMMSLPKPKPLDEVFSTGRRPPHDRSVFEYLTYRHNFDTK